MDVGIEAKIISSTEENLRSKIFRIRGHSVMFDQHLANLYEVNVKALNQAVRRNISRFPAEFMFQLTMLEYEKMRSQFVTASRRNIRHRPLAFTEHGIAMLSSVLRSERAIQVNIAIIKAFIKLRRAILEHRDLGRRVEKLEGRLHITETDIRLLRQDIRLASGRPQPPMRIRGFQM
jgi:hypothetical protein